MKGVINIGSHFGEQYNHWVLSGAKNILFIEPVISNYNEIIREYGGIPGVQIIKTALGTYTGKATMYVDNKHLSFSASILKPTGHLEDYPGVEFDRREEVDITTLDALDYDRCLYDYMYITAQGAELDILRHGVISLEYIDTIKSQVYRKRLYEGCPLVGEFSAYLGDLGYKLIKVEDAGISWDYATYQR